MERQTDYTLDQIREMLKDDPGFSGCRAPGVLCAMLPSGEPSGLIYNEIGLIFLQGEEERKEAEADLLKMLENDNEKIRSMAYFYFVRAGRAAMSSKTLEKFAAFEIDTKNVESIQLAKSKLKTFAH